MSEPTLREALAEWAGWHGEGHDTFISPVKIEPGFVVGCNTCATALGPADLQRPAPGDVVTRQVVGAERYAALAEPRPRRADDGLDVDVLAEAAEKVGLRMAVEWWREVAAEYAAEQGEQG